MYRKDLEQKFKDLYLNPEHCEPLVQVRVWGPRKYTIAEQLASPEKAMEQLSKLRGCDVHSTVMLSPVDEKVFKRLGVNLTCEPKYRG